LNPLQGLALKYPHFLKWNESDGALEMYVDHHILSTMRMCEAKFVEEILNSQYGRTDRYWSLEFGAWVHECCDIFYKEFQKIGLPPQLDPWVKKGTDLWDAYDLDYYKPNSKKLVKEYRTDEKKYHSFGGRAGAAAFLIHYYAFYMGQRFRVVATEVSFGRGREVLLGEFRFPRFKYYEGPEGQSDLIVESWDIVRVFLTGRIDLLVDNTYKVGPVDHKTTATFDGYEHNDFDPHEGITGYIYTTDALLGLKYPDNPHKICRDGWIFHIATNALCEPRFKATLITKTPQQLEDFRTRQVRTARRILEVMVSGVADWNTLVCSNIYNKPCPYRELHRQPPIQREATLQQFYQVKTPWNPEDPPSVRNTLRNMQKENSTPTQETTEPLKTSTSEISCETGKSD
jgi:hypothetical protein